MGTYKIECNVGDCPVCSESADYLTDEYDHETHRVMESYICENCDLIITFIWTRPNPSYAELYDKYPDGISAKQLDAAEQAERYARDKGNMQLERRI